MRFIVLYKLIVDLGALREGCVALGTAGAKCTNGDDIAATAQRWMIG